MDRVFETGLSVEEERQFAQANWWLHDAHWFAAVAQRWGVEEANTINLQAIERAARGAVLQLRRQGVVAPPESLRDLERIFRTMWWLFFPGGMYQSGTFCYEEDEARYIGCECHAYEQVKRAGMLGSYRCGCAAFRDGVRKGLGARFEHEIAESLIGGQGRCVVRFRLEPRRA